MASAVRAGRGLATCVCSSVTPAPLVGCSVPTPRAHAHMATPGRTGWAGPAGKAWPEAGCPSVSWGGEARRAQHVGPGRGQSPLSAPCGGHLPLGLARGPCSGHTGPAQTLPGAAARAGVAQGRVSPRHHGTGKPNHVPKVWPLLTPSVHRPGRPAHPSILALST